MIWADVPEALEKRLKEKPQLITEECLKCNVKGILRLYENEIVQHVIKQQLHSDHMTGLVHRQGAYAQNKQTASEMKATANKLAKPSFLGRDPSGERPIPDSLWDGHELNDQGALLKDV